MPQTEPVVSPAVDPVVRPSGNAVEAKATPRAAIGSNSAFHHDLATVASPAAIWAVWMDVPGWGRWDEGLKSAISTAPLARGVTGRIMPRSGPPSRFVVTEFIAGNSHAFETALPLAKLTVRRSIISTAPTVIRHEVTFSGWLGGFWAARFGPGFRQALPPTMEGLVGIAEASPR